MRIRKRFPYPSFSSSDPQLIINSPDQQARLQPQDQQAPQENPCSQEPKSKFQPSDLSNQPAAHRTIIRSKNPRWVFLGSHSTEAKTRQKAMEGKVIKGENFEEEEGKRRSHYYIREESIFNGEIDVTGSHQLSSSSSDSQVEGWCEGDKVVPLKKRKGNYARSLISQKASRAKMKSKTNKKCMKPKDDIDHEDLHQNEPKGANNATTTTTCKAKKQKRGTTIMEGSRCSRVNGRGWRCCQQTLVGYSLCEHHLGKGRLRSMTSVRNRTMEAHYSPTTSSKLYDETDKLQWSSSMETMKSPKEEEDCRDEYEDEDFYCKDNERKRLSSTKKKRMKLGMVKARSISSLLGQTDG